MLVVKLMVPLLILVDFVDLDGTATFSTVGEKVNIGVCLPGSSSVVDSETNIDNRLDTTKIIF